MKTFAKLLADLRMQLHWDLPNFFLLQLLLLLLFKFSCSAQNYSSVQDADLTSSL